MENVGDASVEIGSGLEVMMSREEKRIGHPEQYLLKYYFDREVVMVVAPGTICIWAHQGTENYHGIDGKLGAKPESTSASQERHSRRGSAA